MNTDTIGGSSLSLVNILQGPPKRKQDKTWTKETEISSPYTKWNNFALEEKYMVYPGIEPETS